MNKEVKQKWLAALRSGKYKQGTGQLRNSNDEFCCLGVLCEVARIEGVIPNPRRRYIDYSYGKGDDRRDGTLPVIVQEWAGLQSQGGNPFVKNQTLASWNDHEKKTFEEIADLVEEYL